MTAIEFVQKFGWAKVNEIINDAPLDWCFSCVDLRTLEVTRSYPSHKEFVMVSDLENLVGNWQLVEIHGLEKSKEIVANAPSDDHFYSWVLGGSGVKDKTVNIGKLRKAIADVESVESLKEVT